MDKVIEAVVESAGGEVAAAISSTTAVDRRILTDGINALLADRLARVVPRVFVIDFHEYRRARGLPADPESAVAIRGYLDDFGVEAVQRWRNTYPVLDDIIRTIVTVTATHLEEVAQRFLADRDELVRRGWISPTATVAQLQALSSDPHQAGRVVTGVGLDDGTRLIYKPRSLSAEVFARFCFDTVGAAAGVDLAGCVPESLDRDGYGWQRDVSAVPARSEADARSYYRAFGASAAILGSLGTTDMHHENVMAGGDRPIFVDLETILHGERNLASNQLAIALISRSKLSLASTLLLPQRMPTGPYSVLLAGVGVPYQQRSQRTEFVLTNVDTDGIDLARQTYEFGHNSNVLSRVDGTKVDLLDYGEEFLDGFRRARQGLVATRRQILDRLSEKPIRLRHILRSTATYARVMEAATHPDNLKDRAAFDRVIGVLSAPPACDRREVQQFVAEAERRAFALLDVPYFTIESDDVRAKFEDLTSVPCVDLSAAERATAGLRLADREHEDFERLVIDEGLAELRSLRMELQPEYLRTDMTPLDMLLGEAGPDVEAGVDLFDRLGVTVTEMSGTATGWLIGNFGPGVGTFDPGTAVSMHDAGGIHILYERAHAHGLVDSGRLNEVTRGVISLRRHYREKLDANAASVASGPLSLAYTLGHDSTVLDWSSTDRAELLARSAEELASNDLMRGLPGVGLLLAAFPDEDTGLLEDILDRIPAGGGPKGQWDLAHGDLGLAWSRFRLATRVGHDQLANRLRDETLPTLEELPPDLSRAWCAGSGGALLVASEMGAESDVLHRLADHALRLPPSGPIDLSVCHGMAGAVQATVHAAQVSGDAELVKRADHAWRAATAHAREHGYFTSDPARQSLLGYFQGWAGILDTTLLLRGATSGENVWVPVAFVAGRCRS